MLVEVKDKGLANQRLLQPPFTGAQDKCGDLEVVTLKVDKKNKKHFFIRIKGRSCHQLFRLYGFLFDKWVRTGIPFDEFVLVKDGRRYFAEITYTAVKDSRLRVSVITNNRVMTGYENDREDNHTLFGYKERTGLQEKRH